VAPASATIELSPGASGTLEFVLTRVGGFIAPISLSIVESFAEVFFTSGAFSPNPTTTLGSTLQMTVAQSAAEFPGDTFGFTVLARSGASTCATAFTVRLPADE
jgi:hypothetical protein